MSLPDFTDAAGLTSRINAYFTYIEGEYHLEYKSGKETKDAPQVAQKVWDREPEPATFAGLTYFLGFNSRRAFDDYTENGEFAGLLKRARLRIEASYERKLHNQSAAGAIFALKTMGWGERTESKPDAEQGPKIMQIKIIESGPVLAYSEKDVVL